MFVNSVDLKWSILIKLCAVNNLYVIGYTWSYLLRFTCIIHKLQSQEIIVKVENT